MSNKTPTVRSRDLTFEMSATRMHNYIYSASKATWLAILRLKPGKSTNALYTWARAYGGSKVKVEATRLASGGIKFGCQQFSPTAVNTIRQWAGLRALPAKSRKSR